MKVPRFVGLVDLGIMVVVAVAIFLPPREMFAASAFKGDETKQFAIAYSEARTMAAPQDGRAIEDLSRRLGEVGFKDWAIDNAIKGSERAKQSPTRWRALLAASVAYVDRLDVVPALDYADKALAACEVSQEQGSVSACPCFEAVRLRLYEQHLAAGVKSGIDPRHDPVGFRKAGESALRSIRLKTGDRERGSASGSGTGSNAPASGGSGSTPSAP
ncbi:MAG: hypothetical protein JWO36_6243 [Myxococcales bacterium]|nr:hypothetical protein [Myxococcales bacterium]